MPQLSRSFFPCVLLAAAALLLSTGCEDADTDVDALGDYQSAARDAKSPPVSSGDSTVEDLTVSPTETTLTKNGGMAAFTAKGGTAPYSWSVADVFRGSVIDSGGASASYQRSSAGDNSVSVTDSAGRKAYAIVKQP